MKKLFYCLLIAITASCSKGGDSSLNDLPKWYSSPTQNDTMNLYGAGEGYTLEEATKSALNNLSSKLMTSISSETSMLMEENKFSINEETRKKINEVVAKITFNNYKVTNSIQKGNKIYAEVAVDRQDFVKAHLTRLEEAHKKMADIYKNTEKKSILEKRNDLARVKEMASEAETISYVLAGLRAIPDLQKNLETYNFYRSSFDQTISKLEFFIDNENARANVIEVIRSGLHKDKIKIVKTKDLSNNNLVIMNVKTYVTTNKIYGSFITKLRVDISLSSNKSKLVASNFVEVTGNSVSGENESFNSAVASLFDKIDKEGVLTIVGIN